MTNKKGSTRRLEKPLASSPDKGKFVKPLSAAAAQAARKKNYIIQEGSPVPFLQALGVMTDAGKVVAAKYDKFRQINRFLELLDDVLPAVPQRGAPLKILDFGSGKSYLTFAVQYFLESVKKIPCQITGVDLKKDVVDSCADLARRLGISNMDFICGDIAAYKGMNPDIVITLHACDTATDYALAFAVEQKAKAILSVPCCQREINSQLKKDSNKDFSALLKHGIFRERFSALVTDAVRAELLEERGYNVQVLEFIDMEGTPKNLMIRATLKEKDATCAPSPSSKLLDAFGVRQKLFELLGGE